jgi:heme exporter protein D
MGTSINSREVMMNTLINWLDMGGYASYVWPAYGVVFFVFVAHFFHVKVQKKRVLRALKHWSKGL